MSEKLNALLLRNGIVPSASELLHYGVKGMKWGDGKTVEELKAEIASALTAGNAPPKTPLEAEADAWVEKNMPKGTSPIVKQGTRELWQTIRDNQNKPGPEQKAAFNKVAKKYEALEKLNKKFQAQKLQRKNIPI